MTTILVIVGICVVVLVTLHHQLFYHFRAVDKGRLYRCGKLSWPALWLIGKHYKIKTVVNLMREDEFGATWFEKQKSLCDKADISYFSIPLATPPPPPPPQSKRKHTPKYYFINVISSDPPPPPCVGTL